MLDRVIKPGRASMRHRAPMRPHWILVTVLKGPIFRGYSTDYTKGFGNSAFNDGLTVSSVKYELNRKA